MGLRIERKVDEAITITLPGGGSLILTRNPDSLSLVNWGAGGQRSTRTLPARLNGLYVLGPEVKMRLRASRRGKEYLSFLIIAPEAVVISRTEEPRTLNTRRPANG